MDADSIAQKEALDKSEESYKAKISALSTIKSNLSDFKDIIGQIQTSESYGFKGSSSDATIATITASGDDADASINSSMTVTTLATPHSLTGPSYSATTSTVGSGTLTINFGTWSADPTSGGGQTLTSNGQSQIQITTTATTTLQQLRDKINNAATDSDSDGTKDVLASIIYDGSNYMLMLKSESGASNEMKVAATSNLATTSGGIGYDYNTTTSNMSQRVSGVNAAITVDGINMTRSSNNITDLFDGLQLNIMQNIESATIKSQGWIDVFSPDKEIIILPFPNINHRESKIVPWDYEVIFVGQNDYYTENFVLSTDDIFDHNDTKPDSILLNSSFDFIVKNISHNIYANLVVSDQNTNGLYEKMNDLVLVGAVDNFGNWKGTSFVIDFRGIVESSYPDPGDKYSIEFERPFWSTDTIHFRTNSSSDQIDIENENLSLDRIKVVPNPYVGTNIYEESILNSDFNQRRKLMFTHLPARCKIKIFTISGILVDEINVFNSTNNGIAYWDLLTNEGLEIAAGMYIFHVESFSEGSKGVKVGKFGVIK